MSAGYSATYDPDTDFDRWFTVLAARRIGQRLGGRAEVLELGSATGLLTRALAAPGRRFTCVERSGAYLARAAGQHGVRLVQSEIEAFTPETAFDAILAVNVLHELRDPGGALRRLLPSLRPGGAVHVTLPNPRSLHRLSALGAGLIGRLDEPSARGVAFATLRIPFAEAFVSEMTELGLALVAREAILPKPLPNAAMERLSPELIEAWDALSGALRDHGAMTYFLFVRADG